MGCTPVEMQFGVPGHRFSCLDPYPVSPTFDGRGAAPMLKIAPSTAKFTLFSTISLHISNYFSRKHIIWHHVMYSRYVRAGG